MAVTIHLAGDAAPQRILVEREKVIVMELVMEVIMMETRAVKQALCVVVIIVRNMATITMRRMIAVRNLNLLNGLQRPGQIGGAGVDMPNFAVSSSYLD